MGVYAFRSAQHGVVFRPQNYRLYHAAVRAEQSGRPGWEAETPQEHWEPTAVQWASGGKISSMTLRRIIGAGGGKDRDRPELRRETPEQLQTACVARPREFPLPRRAILVSGSPMAKSDSAPRWMIGLIILFAGALGTVGAIAVTNAATICERKESQKTQFEDIKARLVRIENKLDALEK